MGLHRGVVCGREGAHQRGAAQECSVGPRMAAAWGLAGVRRRAAQGRSSPGLRRGVAAWGCAGAWHGAVQGRRSAGLRRGVAWG